MQFADSEYAARIDGLRKILAGTGVDAAVFTSMHNISYYSGFTYCSFGRPYGLVVTASECVTISAGIDAGQWELLDPRLDASPDVQKDKSSFSF